jgi:hypothetical protein
LCCDASGPIDLATAIKEAGKVGKVKVVSMDGIKLILDAIKQWCHRFLLSDHSENARLTRGPDLVAGIVRRTVASDY